MSFLITVELGEAEDGQKSRESGREHKAPLLDHFLFQSP